MSRAARQRVLARLFLEAADRSVRRRLAAAVALASLSAGLAVAAPIALKLLVDALAAQPATGAQVVGLACAYVAALGLARVFEQAQAYAFGTGEQRLQQRLNAAMFAHVLRLPMAYHLDRQAGALIQAVTLGLQGARVIVTHVLFSVAPALMQAVLIGVVVAGLFDAALWGAVVGSIVAYAFVFTVGVRRLGDPTRAVAAAQVEAGGVLADSLTNVEPIKAFGAEPALAARYDGLLDEAEQRWRHFHARRLENGLAASLVLAATLALVLILAGRAGLEGRISVGDFVLLNAYLLQIVRPIEMAGFAWRDIAQGSAYLERWRELLSMSIEKAASSSVACASSASAASAPAIRFENVSFAYGAGALALQDVSFETPGGTTLAIVGPSGAGKSSLLRLLLRYYEPSAGRIWIGDEPVDALDLDALRRRIAIVGQDTVLFNESVRANLLFARPDASEAELARAIEQARLQDLIARLPQGMQTMVGERGLKLSGGEKQRIAIARAALRDAPILIFDEATSSLDAITERAIRQEMWRAAQGRTSLIITHRLALASLADQIVVLKAGRVAQWGRHADLLAATGLYAEMWAQEAAAA